MTRVVYQTARGRLAVPVHPHHGLCAAITHLTGCLEHTDTGPGVWFCEEVDH
ncbi:MAG: hypothetical protein GWN07_03295 [Actinobacteria bacterium]|nr:hypothetical protein [Actinomycetota bacterium]NIS29150.1 hypothetical protein [Actinomycetota bacterium]NIU64550.1 hypothetical protein [Actinomycetota bacterium]NIW26341.1 hypothetical protein [Actinomycetota bacterium]NIX18909.1 hypothetical protein [Actinomycetota bacterium]